MYKNRIYYEDTDCGGIVYHSNYLKFCERARSELFFENGIKFENIGFVVKELNASFIKAAKLGDIVEINTYVIGIKKCSVLMEQNIFVKNESIFESKITLVCIDIKKNKISKIPRDLLKIIENINES